MYIISLVGFGIPGLIETGLLAMTPLALAAVGECLNEQAGTINVGIEGIFLITAVIGVYWAEIFKSGLHGLLLGSATGAVIGLVFGIVCIYGKANQVIAGMGLNIFALGLGPFLLMAIWAFPGIHVFRHELMFLPLQINIRGASLSISAVTVAAIMIAVLAYLLLYRTLLGIRIRAAGENPIAVDVAGVSVGRVRLLMCVVGGALAGLGGAFMPLAWFGGVVKEISAGRGFIALAAVVFAGLDPLLALAAAFIFGFSEGVAFTVVVTPGVKEVVPFYFVQMAPYAVTLLILVVALGGKKFPRALGKPYVRE
jgi:general nucleoside transport system permease protein